MIASAVLAGVMASAALAFVSPAPEAHAAGTWNHCSARTYCYAEDITSDTGVRTFKDSPKWIRLFHISFETTHADEVHRVLGTVVASSPRSNLPYPEVLSAAELRCWDKKHDPHTSTTTTNPYDYLHELDQQRNVVTGRSPRPLRLRYSYVAKKAGIHQCDLMVHTTMPASKYRPKDGSPTRAVLKINPGSYLQVTDQIKGAGGPHRITKWTDDDHRFLSDERKRSDWYLAHDFTVPKTAEYASATADLMVTACTSTNPDGCRTSERGTSTTFGTQFVVQQLKSDGTVCHRTPVRHEYTVDNKTHHETIDNSAHVKVLTGNGCTRRFHTVLGLIWKSGGALKVHDYSAISAVIPDKVS